MRQDAPWYPTECDASAYDTGSIARYRDPTLARTGLSIGALFGATGAPDRRRVDYSRIAALATRSKLSA